MSQAIVAQVRAKYPTPLADTHASFLLEVAGTLGLGLVIKNSGTRITLPDGTTVSQDVVMDRTGAAWDILSDGEGAATPMFNRIDPIDSNRFYFVPPIAQPTPTPTPTPTPSVDLSAVLAKLDQLAVSNTDIIAHLDFVNDKLAAVDVRFNDINNTLSTMLGLLDIIIRKQQNPPFYKTKVFGASVTLNPEIR